MRRLKKKVTGTNCHDRIIWWVSCKNSVTENDHLHLELHVLEQKLEEHTLLTWVLSYKQDMRIVTFRLLTISTVKRVNKFWMYEWEYWIWIRQYLIPQLLLWYWYNYYCSIVPSSGTCDLWKEEHKNEFTKVETSLNSIPNKSNKWFA